MKNIIAMLVLAISICSGCSQEEGETIYVPQQNARAFPYFFLTVDDFTVELEQPDSGNDHYLIDLAAVNLNGDIFTAYIKFGGGYSSPTQNDIALRFDREGKVMSVSRQSLSREYGQFDYYGYDNFPSNYFDVHVIAIDEVQKRIKFTFSGNLYKDKFDLNSLSTAISGDAYTTYEKVSEGQYPLSFQSVQQYCTAKINSNSWVARRVAVNGVFTSTDAYKLQIHFAASTLPGSYNFDSSSTDNYIRFYKFNPATLIYDDYNVQGVVAHSYREYHGGTNYSFIGTFSFTAINSNNPADVISVADGNFRSYQIF